MHRHVVGDLLSRMHVWQSWCGVKNVYNMSSDLLQTYHITRAILMQCNLWCFSHLINWSLDTIEKHFPKFLDSLSLNMETKTKQQTGCVCGTWLTFVFSVCRLMSPRPSLLSSGCDTRGNNSPQKPMDLKQLKQRAAAIPPIVSNCRPEDSNWT